MPLDKTGRSVVVNGSRRTWKSHSSRWHLSLVAPRREAEGSIRRRPQLSDCCWAARAFSEDTALHRFAKRAWFEVCLRYLFMWRENIDLEDDLSTARVFFNLKRRNLSSKPCEVASLYFFQLGFLNFLFFFSSTSAAGSLRFQFWNPLLLFALASLWQNQEGTSSSESLFELNFDPSRSSPSNQKLHN